MIHRGEYEVFCPRAALPRRLHCRVLLYGLYGSTALHLPRLEAPLREMCDVVEVSGAPERVLPWTKLQPAFRLALPPVIDIPTLKRSRKPLQLLYPEAIERTEHILQDMVLTAIKVHFLVASNTGGLRIKFEEGLQVLKDRLLQLNIVSIANLGQLGKELYVLVHSVGGI